MKRPFLLLFLTLVTPLPAVADVYNCNGAFTTKPCAEGAKAVLKDLPPPTPQEVEAKETVAAKRSMYHELVMDELDLRRAFNERIAIQDIERLCFKTPSTVEECQKAINERAEKISVRKHELETLDAKKTELELAKERNKIAAQQAEENNTQIIINDEPTILGPVGPHHGGYIGGHHGEYIGGSSVSAQGSFSTGNGSGQVTVGAQSLTTNSSYAGGSVIVVPPHAIITPRPAPSTYTAPKRGRSRFIDMTK